MADYLFADLPIASTLRLSLVRPAAAVAPVLAVARKRGSSRPRAVQAWRHQWRNDGGRVVMGLAVTQFGYLLRFPRQCDFVVSADAARIDTRPHRQVAPEALEHLLADQVLPRCLAQRGELIAHAAGIAFGTEIALFVGESGRGKSTLAGLFLRTGRTVLTDDCLVLRPTPEAVRAFPTYPSLRLHPDSAEALSASELASAVLPSYSGKLRLALPNAFPLAATGRISALYFLGDTVADRTEVRIEPLAPSASCIRLMEQSFQLDVLDREAVQRLLARAGEVVSRVPSFALDFPRDFSRSADLVARIEQHFTRVAHQSRPA